MLKLRSLFLIVLVLGLAASAFAQDSIQVGDTVEGSEDNDAVQYELELAEDQTVAITLESEDFDTYLEIYDENENLLDWNDDYEGSRSVSYLVFTADDDMTLIISVRSFGADGPEGDYELTVEEIEVTDEVDLGTLAYGDSVEVEPNGAREISFTFEAAAGDVVTIDVVSSDYEDSRMVLEDPDGDTLMEDDDSGSGTNPAIRRLELEDAGTYTVTITGYSDSALFSELEVSLEQSSVLLLNDGAQTITLDDEITTDAMVLDVEEDQSYIITVTFDDDIDSSLYLRMVEEDLGYPRTTVTIAGTSAFTFIFTAQDDGRVQVQLELWSYQEEVEMTVEAQVLE